MKMIYSGFLLMVFTGFCYAEAALEMDVHLGIEKHLRIPVMIGDSGPFDFILDTAASRSTITQPLVTALSLIALVESEKTIVHGTTGFTEIKRFGSLQLDFGDGYKWETGIVPALNSMHTEGKPFYGILGSDFFESHAIEIDAIAGKLRMAESIDDFKVDMTAATPIYEVAHGIWGFDAILNGSQVTALLDTGARRSIVNTVAVPATEATAEITEIQGSSGHSGRGVAATEQVVTVGGHVWQDLTLDVSDLHVFTQLGIASEPVMIFASDLLFEYSLIIDYANKRMLIRDTSRS
jgi:hypothetical protein